MRTLFAVCALVVLAGCMEPPPPPPDWAAIEHQRCVSYGFTPGTALYGQCRMQMEDNRLAAARQDDAMRRQVILNHLLMR